MRNYSSNLLNQKVTKTGVSLIDGLWVQLCVFVFVSFLCMLCCVGLHVWVLVYMCVGMCVCENVCVSRFMCLCARLYVVCVCVSMCMGWWLQCVWCTAVRLGKCDDLAEWHGNSRQEVDGMQRIESRGPWLDVPMNHLTQWLLSQREEIQPPR